MKSWTLAELDRLPDDGNRYELIDGDLFVTPAPSPAHAQLVAVLNALLTPYVRAQAIGCVCTPRAVIRTDSSEVEPDLVVRSATSMPPMSWAEVPTPSLVVEILSQTTWRRDREQRRALYERIGVETYWMVDRRDRCIHVARRHADDTIERAMLEWRPTGATATFHLDVAAYFDEAPGAPGDPGGRSVH